VGLVTHWVSFTCFVILSFASPCTVCWRDLPNVKDEPRSQPARPVRQQRT
jgi:hypothetical protein